MVLTTQELKPIKIFRREAQLIPLRKISTDLKDEILESYRLQLFDDKKCFKCAVFKEGNRGVADEEEQSDSSRRKKPVDMDELYAQGYTEAPSSDGPDGVKACATCESYYGTRKMAKIVEHNDKKYLSVPRASVAKLDTVLTSHGIKGVRVDKYEEVQAFHKPIKMLWKPYKWQEEAAEVFLTRKRGMIEAPPRSGKTLLGALVTRKLGVKTLIIASQREWLEQFEKTFIGNEATGDKPATTIKKKRIGMCSTIDDFKKYDVCLTTFALFMSSTPEYEDNPEKNEKKYELYKKYMKALRKADKLLKVVKTGKAKDKDRKELEQAKADVKKYIKYRDNVMFGPHIVDPTTGQKVVSQRIKTGMKLLKKIRHMFGFVCVDEAHGAAALETSRVLSQFSAEYFMGLSGTPTRKISSQDQVFRMLIGPVIYKAQVERMVPKIKLLNTGYNSGVQMSKIKTQYARMISKLETDPKRNAVICQAIVKAVKNGHSVMVPMSRIKAIGEFAKQLDKAMTAVNPTESLVTVFHGALHKKIRDANLAKIKSGEAKVIVGNISLLSTGLNIPPLSMLIERMTITSNLPKCMQRTARILTPMEGKKQPVILMLLDNCPLQRVTARKEFNEAILPTLKPIMSADDMKAFQEWSGSSRSSASAASSENEDGVRRWGAPKNDAPKQRFSNEFYEFAGGQNAL